MKGKMITVLVTGVIEEVEISAPPSLAEMQRAVGGYIEQIPIFRTYQGAPAVAFCNEEGKIYQLPRNERATALWQESAHRPIYDHLVGPVLIITGDRALMDAL